MAALMLIRMLSKHFTFPRLNFQYAAQSFNLNCSGQHHRLYTTEPYATQTDKSNNTHPKKAKKTSKKKKNATSFGEISKAGCVYRSWLAERLQEAERSLLLRMDQQADLDKVLEKVSQKHGAVKKHFQLQLPSNRHKFVLLEMKKSVMHRSKRQIIMSDQPSSQPSDINSQLRSTHIEDNKATSSEAVLWKKLRQCKSLSAEMVQLHEHLMLDEAGIRCHFFVLSYVSQVVKQTHHNVLSKVTLMPFGSVASNLGIQGSSDLDLTMLCDNPQFFSRTASKAVLEDICNQLRRHPMFEKVIFLRHARVPIIKFTEKTTGLHVDLSWNKICGVLFAELLFLINKYEKSFYPLIFTLKRWAHCNNLWNGQAGVSSFMLTMMLIGFLQHREILPPLQTFYQGNEPLNELENSFQSWDKVEFVQIQHSAWTLFNEKVDCGQLLREFLEFYSEFSYKELCIDLLSGTIYKRDPDNLTDAMCLWNPLEAGHNICRNVRSPHLRRFITACQKGALQLKHMEEGHIFQGNKDKDTKQTDESRSETRSCLERLFVSSEESEHISHGEHVVDIGELFYEDIDGVDGTGYGARDRGDGVVLKCEHDNVVTAVEVGDKVEKG